MALFKLLPRRFLVAEESMVPALQPGDSVLAIGARRFRRGDIAVFEHPGRAAFWLVKRVVGMAGERLEIADGVIYVGGERLEDPWGNGSTTPNRRWSIPDGHVFVLSDARSATLADSRTFGPVPLAGAYRVVFPLPNQKNTD